MALAWGLSFAVLAGGRLGELLTLAIAWGLTLTFTLALALALALLFTGTRGLTGWSSGTRGARDKVGPGFGRDLTFHLIDEGLEFGLGETQGLGIVAEDIFRGTLDAAAEAVDGTSGAVACLSGLGFIALAEHFGGEFEGFAALGFGGGELLHPFVEARGHETAPHQIILEFGGRLGLILGEVAEGIVELSGDEGFGGFCGLGELGGAFDEVGIAVLLFRDAAGQVFVGCRCGQGGAGRLVGGLDFPVDSLLLSGEFAGLGAHFAEVFGEFAGGFSPELVAGIFELAFGAGTGGEGLGDGSLAGGFGGALHVLAGLVELALLFAGAGLVFGALHALLEFVHVGEHALLFLLKSFQTAPDFLAIGLCPGLLQGSLELLELFVDVLLPAGEFLEPIDDLKLFAALGILIGGAGVALGLVAILRFREVEFVELPLVASLAPSALTVLTRPGHIGFAGLETEQGPVGGLFCG